MAESLPTTPAEGRPEKRQTLSSTRLATPPAGLQLQISERRLVLMAGDLAAIIAAILAALYIWSVVGRLRFDLAFVLSQGQWFVILPLLWLTLAAANDFYDLRTTSRLGRSLLRLLFIETQLLVVYLIIFFISERDTLPRLFIFYYAGLSFGLIGVWRLWRPFLIGWRGARRRALIIGAGPTAHSIAQVLREDAATDYEVVGFIESAGAAGEGVVGTGAELPFIVRARGVSELIIAYGEDMPADLFQGVMACYEHGVTIVPMPLLYEQITGRVPIEHVGQAHWQVVLPLEGNSLAFKLYLGLKRLIDIACALVGLGLFALLFVPLVIVMQIDSRGPIFYRQERVGRGGRLFKVIKLRSMIPDAEKHSGPKWASADDPRITRMGRLFRKTRLDEVPQLWNVLRGEMSIVGPRPERPVFVEQLTQQIPFYRTRLVVAPGLTGWAQVKYKYGNSVEDALIKLQYDLYYIRHRSLTLDMLIMLRTVGKIVTLGGT
jgi:exopolysaccharide biosynthesis polyprenyl glycosylphosphotransferase